MELVGEGWEIESDQADDGMKAGFDDWMLSGLDRLFIKERRYYVQVGDCMNMWHLWLSEIQVAMKALVLCGLGGTILSQSSWASHSEWVMMVESGMGEHS